MRIQFLLLIGFIYSVNTHAQPGFRDDYSDGNFTQNPEWTTSSPNTFRVNANKNLQLNAPAAGKASISTEYSSDSSMVWEFYLQLDFAPSASNRVIISPENNRDARDFAKNYALLIGEDGTDDRIRCYLTSSGDITGSPVFSGKSTCVINNQVKARIRLTRSASNRWSLEADYSGGYNFQKEAEYQDNGPTYLKYKEKKLIIATEFTETRKDKFFFDDFKVGRPEVDSKAPQAISATAIDPVHVELLFDEVIAADSAKNPSNYSISPGPIYIDSVSISSNRIQLRTAASLLPDRSYQIHFSAISDLYGNTSPSAILEFNTAGLLQTVEKYDVIINEIMVDPLPQVALPKAEYIEIFNRSNKRINLKGWKIKDAGKTTYLLPEYHFDPGKYLIISKRDAKIDFGKYGDTLLLAAIFALDSGSDDLYLFDNKGFICDELHYDTETYKDESKSEGGYSLERINPSQPCLGAANFCASTSPNGGTPGQKNAVFSATLQRDTMRIQSVFAVDSQTLRLQFNHPPDFLALKFLNFSGALQIDSFLQGQKPTEVVVRLKDTLQKGSLYTLITDLKLLDCAGNRSVVDTLRFALAEKASPADLLISEVLFNPRAGSYDFVELYNNSQKAINLRNLFVANEKNSGEKVEISADYVVLPGQYVLVSENPGNIALNYHSEAASMLKHPLPSLPDDEGNITLYYADAPGKNIIDKLDYSSFWHYSLLNSRDGVSLERLSFDYPTQDQFNWASAASVAGFATPGYKNSQHRKRTEEHSDDFTLESARISPDNDGFEDFLLLHYKMEPNTNAEIKIFDLNGVLIKSLVQNETLPTMGEIRWDGLCDDGSRVAAGIYALVMEYFRPDGSTRKMIRLLTVLYKI